MPYGIIYIYIFRSESTLVELIICQLSGTKPLTNESDILSIGPRGKIIDEIWIKIDNFCIQGNSFWNICKISPMWHLPASLQEMFETSINKMCLKITYLKLLQHWVAMCETINTWRQRQNGTISQRTFSNAFSWIKIYKFHFRLHWRLFLRFRLTIFQHWFR